MKVLFINPPFSKYDGVEGHGGRVAPLNLGYLAAYLRQQKPATEINILDCEALALSYEQVHDYLKNHRPDIAAITIVTPAYDSVLAVTQIIKEVNPICQVVVGGPHPTALPNEVLMEKNIDFAVIGEGEITFLELVEELESDKNFGRIKGLAFKGTNGEIFINSPRPLIENLDVLPFPAKDMLPVDAYFLPPTKRITGGASTNIVTSRGCPFRCTFCMAKTAWGRKTRFRSVKNVVDEIEEDFKKYKHVDFTFHDELFTASRQRVLDFCQELLRRQLHVKWFCQARCGSIDEEMAKIMKKAGCEMIGFGFESGDEQILKSMKKDNSLEKAKESAKICQKTGIRIYGSFILGYPGETKASIKKTVFLAKELDCDTAAFFIAVPCPGTELFKLALEKGYIKKPIDWKTFAPLSKGVPPMEIPTMSKKELMKAKRWAYRSFYLRPRYIFKKLKAVKNLNDFKTLLQGFKIFKQLAK